MSKSHSVNILSGVAGLMLLIAPALVRAASQESRSTSEPAGSETRAVAEAATPEGSRAPEGQAVDASARATREGSASSHPPEGVQVHGSWTIEVRKPDGTVVERREFDNNLLIGGLFFFNDLITRSVSMGGWRLVLDHSLINHPCEPFDGCYSVESTDPESGEHISKTLTVNSGKSGTTLQGFVVASSDVGGSLDRVNAFVRTCPPSSSSSACPGTETGLVAFSTATFSPVVNLNPGFQAFVTYSISFSNK